MKITVATLSDVIFTLDVANDLELENFKAFCEVESGIAATELILLFNGQKLIDNKKSLKDYGIADGDCLILQHQMPPTTNIAQNTALSNLDFSTIQIPGSSQQIPPLQPISVALDDNPELIRNLFLSQPDQLALLKQNNSKLADALLSGSLGIIYLLNFFFLIFTNI